jgi:adenylate kinase family enzyme
MGFGFSLSNAAMKLEAEKPCYICIIGGPGSGKTTQSRFIYELFDFHHISTGQILRQAVNTQKLSNWENVQQRMTEGKSIDSDIVLKLLSDEIDRQKEKHIVMDGFPINEENFEAWNMNIKEKLDAIFYFEITENEMKTRLMKRKERPDDNEISIRERIRTFNYETKPLIEYLRNKGKVTIFDGMKSKEDLNAELKAEIMKRKLYK